MTRFLIAVILSHAAGCIITTGGDDTGDLASITVSWMLTSAATNTVAPCPAGYETAALYSQQVDSTGTPLAGVDPIIDLFNCSDGIGLSDLLPPSYYSEWVVITNTDNTMQFAKSKSNLDDRITLDLTTTDLTYGTEIIVDGGFFTLTWNLVGATSNTALTCAGANTDTIAVTLDDLTTAAAQTQLFPCTAQAGLTTGQPTGTYTIATNALDANQNVGSGAPTNQTIGDPAALQPVTDIGMVTIPITGM